ncbi:MAG TPA: response regulator [Clostridia bacterium]
MIRTVIVDDEVLATVGLKAMIDWPAHGFEIVGEGDNGENGLEVIRRTRPDMVITDIMMPRVDGLEMMRRVLEEFPGVRFVVLSGYNEFSLVKKALQQGARDYILKLTLRPETLLETLDTLRRDILAARPGGGNPADGAPRLDEGRETRRELRRAMEGHGEAARVGPVLSALGFAAGAELRLALVRVCPQEKTGTASGEARRFGDVLVDMIGKLAADFYPSYCFPWEDDAFILLMAIERDADADRRGQGQEQELENLGESLVRLLRQYVNIEAAVGFSGPCEGGPGLTDAFSQAEKSVSRSFYDGYGRAYLSVPARKRPHPFRRPQARPVPMRWSRRSRPAMPR